MRGGSSDCSPLAQKEGTGAKPDASFLLPVERGAYRQQPRGRRGGLLDIIRLYQLSNFVGMLPYRRPVVSDLPSLRCRVLPAF
jgi:hypothetical protein